MTEGGSGRLDGRGRRGARPGSYPPFLWPAYRSTVARAPAHDLLDAPASMATLPGPGPALAAVSAPVPDLTRDPATGGQAVGERIVVTGRVLDGHGDPVPGTLIEIWQANAAGRYVHERDRHDAPLDPNFTGIGRCLTDETGRYRFVSIRPGAYPWQNHPNAWRPSHIHLSLFGRSFGERLVTQMYFPGDPLHELDPILNSIPDPEARSRLVAGYAHEVTEPGWALGYRFDVVLAGPDTTPFEAGSPR